MSSFGDGSRLPHQDKKCCLERIVGIGDIPQLPTARSQHHRPMPLYQSGKGYLIMTLKEMLQQGSITRVGKVLISILWQRFKFARGRIRHACFSLVMQITQE